MKEVLSVELKKIKPSDSEIKSLKKEINDFIAKLKNELSKAKYNADVFLGGSFARGTMLKEHKYDFDIFVRFDWRFDDISELLLKPVQSMAKKYKMKMERIHGSRDYFRVYAKDGKAYFEVIPVTKIKSQKEERNVTDLSYFHVPYVKRKIKGLEEQALLAKAFMHCQRVYGAETYVQGFSGYATELLIIYYKSFLKMLRELAKAKKGERIVIDIEKKYKRKNEVFLELNEAKLQSPIILIDPTYKERNALASLSKETFERFQESARNFLKSPSSKYFTEKKIDSEELKALAKKNKAEFIHVILKTGRQAGDIAGTKLKKFHYFLEGELKKYFDLIQHEFHYNGKQEADLYLIVKSKKEIIQIGPPMYTKKLRKHIKAFKATHKNTFVRNNILHARIKIDFTGKEFIGKIARDKDKLNEMGVTSLSVQ